MYRVATRGYRFHREQCIEYSVVYAVVNSVDIEEKSYVEPVLILYCSVALVKYTTGVQTSN